MPESLKIHEPPERRIDRITSAASAGINCVETEVAGQSHVIKIKTAVSTGSSTFLDIVVDVSRIGLEEMQPYMSMMTEVENAHEAAVAKRILSEIEK